MDAPACVIAPATIGGISNFVSATVHLVAFDYVGMLVADATTAVAANIIITTDVFADLNSKFSRHAAHPVAFDCDGLLVADATEAVAANIGIATGVNSAVADLMSKFFSQTDHLVLVAFLYVGMFTADASRSCCIADFLE